MSHKLPYRRTLSHTIPEWVEADALFFITICTNSRGVNHLCRTHPGTELLETVDYYEQVHRWHPHIFLMMPDHLHMIAGFPEEPGMQSTITNWKRYTARELGIIWQPDFFEHRLRYHESAEEKVDYIRMNPVRAGLVRQPEDWPWVRLSDDLR